MTDTDDPNTVGFRWFWPSTLRYRRPLAHLLVASVFFVATDSSMSDPLTDLHYAPNGNFVNSPYDPGKVGFNLADIGSVSELNGLPQGVKGLVYLGLTNGADANFQAVVSAYIGNPNLYGFYIADDPNAGLATNLKAEADWIHANVPHAETFMVEQNLSNVTTPIYVYTPANTHIDLFGVDGYPVRSDVPNNLDYNIIPLYVSAAEAAGVPQSDIVPVYQAFGGGGYPTYILPTAAQERHILSTWGSVIPAPAFDFAYSWGVQVGDTAISTDPALQAVFAVHNAEGPVVPEISTWAMMLLGFAGFGILGYRWQRRATLPSPPPKTVLAVLADRPHAYAGDIHISQPFEPSARLRASPMDGLKAGPVAIIEREGVSRQCRLMARRLPPAWPARPATHRRDP